ncbi:MAG TPA: FKBP-type peptidyl-prolyl cis-trans isomerase [Verrucomicrobiae bacterium]|nr:FKBP-type peptidyl-prolyl cis-trans isomerase [Verrucomicrobiae bacterium]
MKLKVLIAIICLNTAAPLLADDLDATNVLADDKSKLSYAMGMFLGHSWQQQGIDVDPDLVLRGIKDEQSGGATLLPPQEAQAVLREFQQTLIAKETEMANTNKTAGEAFLAQNKSQPGVVTLPDGLEYKVITEGIGASPTADDIVTVNYRGTLLNGTEFDSSYKRGEPAQFRLNGVIPGWTEALQKMKVGSKWQLFIPSDLAYGERGMGNIPPNSTLIFEVELLSIENPNAPAAPPAAANPPPKPAVSNNPPPAPMPTSDVIEVQGTNVHILNSEDVKKLQTESQTN